MSAMPPQWAQSRPPECERITGLSYAPPPAKEEEEETRELIGTQLPQTPEVLATSQRYRGPSSIEGKNFGRPGEPVNKVFVQFSNDLEGFLPYSLVISDEIGLDFKAMNAHPNFRIDPLNVLKAARLDYASLMKEETFISLSKSITARPLPADAAAGGSRHENAEERVKPPYEALVQLTVRRTVLEGGQVLVFIAVQSDRLAAELVRSCQQLKRRRAIQYYCDCHQSGYPDGHPDDHHGGSAHHSQSQGGHHDSMDHVSTRSHEVPSRGNSHSNPASPMVGASSAMRSERSNASQDVSPTAHSTSELDTMSSVLPNHGDRHVDPLRLPDDVDQ